MIPFIVGLQGFVSFLPMLVWKVVEGGEVSSVMKLLEASNYEAAAKNFVHVRMTLLL